MMGSILQANDGMMCSLFLVVMEFDTQGGKQ